MTIAGGARGEEGVEGSHKNGERFAPISFRRPVRRKGRPCFRRARRGCVWPTGSAHPTKKDNS